MLKKNSIVKFVLLAIIAVLGILLCVCPFNIPSSSNVYKGFLYSIEKGIDLEGGVSALYKCTLPDGSLTNIDKSIDSSIDKLRAALSRDGYIDLSVARQGNNKVRIEMAGARDTDNIFSYIEDYKEISMTIEKYSENSSLPKVYVSSSDISTAYLNYDYDNSAYGVTIEFNSTSKQNLQQLKDFAEKTTDSKIYIYLGEFSTQNLLAELSAGDLDFNSIFITASSEGSYSTSSSTEAATIAYSIVAGSLDVKLELMETSLIDPALGSNVMLLLGIASGVSVLIAFIFLLIRYRELGLLGILSLVFFLIFNAFFLQAIPFVVLNLAGIFGIVLSFVLALISNMFVFEKIRDEYAIGKKLYLACKGGFKKSLWGILDSHVILILACIFIWIFAPASIKCFGITLLIGTLLSMFSSLLMTKYFVKIYLPINSTKAKRLNLYRDNSVKEIKEDEIEIISEDQTGKEVGGGINE